MKPLTTKIKFEILAGITLFLIIILAVVSRRIVGFRVAGSLKLTLEQAKELPISEPITLTDEQGEYPLGFSLEILEDPGGKPTVPGLQLWQLSRPGSPDRTIHERESSQ